MFENYYLKCILFMLKLLSIVCNFLGVLVKYFLKSNEIEIIQ